jgi:hypothetical protein
MADQRIALSARCTETASMTRFLCATVLALLLSAAPAFAQDPAPVCSGAGDVTSDCTSGPAVGQPDVITDPADEVQNDGETGGEPVDPRAEQHVLGDSATASSPDTAEPVAAPVAAPASTPVAAPAAAAPARGELPFTGVDAWLIALAGSGLLAAGLALRLRAAA